METKAEYDVVIIGGALSGASAALLLLQENRQLRVLIIEKSDAFSRRVGEATVEVSAYFLCRELGLTGYLLENHLAKQGLRFWLANDSSTPFEECAEIGGKYMARVPSFQLDRATLDQEVLDRACKLGAELVRPAKVASVNLTSGGQQVITFSNSEGLREIKSRWVIDASGVAALLARANGWFKPNEEHPTTAVWARWRGVAEWDGPSMSAKYPCWANIVYGFRGTATNHFMGDGWWAWCIPLRGGDVSIGIVFDQRLVQFPTEGAVGDRLKAFLMEHPGAREIIRNAEPIEGDVHWRKNLAYSSSRMFGDGFALVGDSAGFIDPFYSPGMDWISYTVSSAVDLILKERSGAAVGSVVERVNNAFLQSYSRWFKAVYKNKYQYLGSFELLKAAFLLDLGLYYMGVASQPFKLGKRAFLEPIFSSRPSVPFYHFMSFYTARFAKIAQAQRARGKLANYNSKRRFLFPGFTFSPLSVVWILYALCCWIGIEVNEIFDRLTQPAKQRENNPAQPVPAGMLVPTPDSKNVNVIQ